MVKRIKQGTATLDAFDALVAIGPPAAEPLIELLTDNDVNKRGNAARALGRIKDPRAVKPLIAILANEGWSTMWTEIVRRWERSGTMSASAGLSPSFSTPGQKVNGK